jgi:hypothetical protein
MTYLICQQTVKCNFVALIWISFPTFAAMKRKFAVFNLMLMALVQLTMAYQSFHYIKHNHKHHQEQAGKHFGHAGHEHDDDCAVCDFHFDFFVAPQEFCLSLHFTHTTIPYRFNAVEGANYFTGSLFALRAPPVSA